MRRGEYMITRNIEYFDLRRICESGQIFRMYEREDGYFDVFSADRHLRLRQQGSRIDFFCSEEDFDGYWRRFFDLDRDYGAIVRGITGQSACACPDVRDGGTRDACPDVRDGGKRDTCSDARDGGKRDTSDIRAGEDDGFLAQACRYGAGIRILRQDIWEMLISFIISQQKQIPSIRKCIEALCERFGEKKEDELIEWNTFPTPQAIAAGGPDGLKGLSLGYRERYIYETAVKYLTDGLPYETVETMGLDRAKAYFTSYCGVGEKVANCICLFGAGYVDAFPIDTHIKDILYREYYLKEDSQPEASAERKGQCIKKSGERSAGESAVKTAGLPAGKAYRDHGLTQADYEELVRVHFDRFRGYRGIVQQWIFAWELVRG